MTDSMGEHLGGSEQGGIPETAEQRLTTEQVVEAAIVVLEIVRQPLADANDTILAELKVLEREIKVVNRVATVTGVLTQAEEGSITRLRALALLEPADLLPADVAGDYSIIHEYEALRVASISARIGLAALVEAAQDKDAAAAAVQLHVALVDSLIDLTRRDARHPLLERSADAQAAIARLTVALRSGVDITEPVRLVDLLLPLLKPVILARMHQLRNVEPWASVAAKSLAGRSAPQPE